MDEQFLARLGFLVGVALLGVSVRSWRGRSAAARRWATGRWGPRLHLGVLPGGGLLLMVGCAGSLFAGVFQNPVIAAFALAGMLAGLVLIIAAGLRILPGWWGPNWYRDQRDRVG